MNAPHRSRRTLSIVALSFFALALGSVALEFQLVTTSSAQFAAGVLAAGEPATSAKASSEPLKEECKPGEVHTIKQAEKGAKPDRGRSVCYAKNPQGTMAQTTNATKDRMCQLSKPDKCIVQYCPPADALGKKAKPGTCFVVSCSGNSSCLKETLATLGKPEGASSIIRDTLLKDPNTAALIPGQDGGIDGSKFLTEVLNPEVAKEIQKTDAGGDDNAIEKIYQVAKAVESGNAPCDTKDTACKPTFQLNKELAIEQKRLAANPCAANPQGPGCTGVAQGPGGEERSTMRIPGGAGLPPPPLRPPPQQHQQTPQQSSPGGQCQSVPQPSTPCQGSVWQPQYGGGTCAGNITSWTCVPSGSGSTLTAQTPTAELSCTPRLAEASTTISISYACSVGTSTGSGFETGGVTRGTASALIASSTAGNSTVFGLTCTNQTVSSATQCVVEIVRPQIVLVANPATVAAGASSQIGWVTGGMQSCLISSPSFPGFTTQNATNTSVNGTARTPELSSSADFVLTCATLTGSVRTATTTVQVSNTASGASTQLASVILAADTSSKPASQKPKAIEEACNPGEVHTIRAGKEPKPQVTPSTCFARNAQGIMTQTADATKDRMCQLSKPNQCIVQYCPPPSLLAKEKAGTCFVVSCSGKKDCLKNTLTTLGQTNGAAAVMAGTLLGDGGRTAALAPGQGSMNGDEFLARVLSSEGQKQIAEQIRASGGEEPAIEKIANMVESGSAPCTSGKDSACTPIVQLNKELATAQARLAGKVPPTGPGIQGPGVQTGPQSDNTGFKFPNIHKDPSGTDVLAWARYLLGGNDKKNQPPPPQSGQSQGCVSAPQPPASQCQGGVWQSVSFGNCVTGWQCLPGGSNTGVPTAQISCQPQIADAGMTASITYSCSAGTSSGSGFTANGTQSGATTTILAVPPGNTNTATFGLTCTDEGRVGTAQCSVQVAKPGIVLIANPESVKSGGTSALGWVTAGMKSCVISSPDLLAFTSQNTTNTSVNGTATTPALTTTSATSTYNFLLHCVTVGGGTRDATTTVTATL